MCHTKRVSEMQKKNKYLKCKNIDNQQKIEALPECTKLKTQTSHSTNINASLSTGICIKQVV